MHRSGRNTDARQVEQCGVGFDPALDCSARVWEAGRATWPDVHLERVAIQRHLARLASAGHACASGPRHSADLFLACACALGERHALAAFERAILPRAIARLAKSGFPAQKLQEVVPELIPKLLVGSAGAEPRIATYAGRGPLVSWVCAAALRLAIDQSRREQRPLKQRGPAPAPATAPDPESEHLRAMVGCEVKSAFERAFAALSQRERNVLRLHFLDGLNVDRIGAVYCVHRSTAARWLSQTRARLLEATRDGLSKQLRLSAEEVDSLILGVPSRIDLSISRLLGRDSVAA